jgi:L,D-peptidoglycan transpeptidase YkuD (ErfK/YbiS/YcfS/YnhG family)
MKMPARRSRQKSRLLPAATKLLSEKSAAGDFFPMYYCVDVNASPLYNRIVDTRVVGKEAVVGSTEPMRRDIHLNGDQLYKMGFVIEHNSQGTPAAGSCIFAHLWRSPRK